MSNAIRYADLWALFRELGFDCDTLDEQNHRICEFVPTDTRIGCDRANPGESGCASGFWTRKPP